MYEQKKPVIKSCRTLDNLQRASENIVARRDCEQKPLRSDAPMSASQCQNGVCSLNWKPKRPA